MTLHSKLIAMTLDGPHVSPRRPHSRELTASEARRAAVLCGLLVVLGWSVGFAARTFAAL